MEPMNLHSPKHIYCLYEKYEHHTYAREFHLHPRNIHSLLYGNVYLLPGSFPCPGSFTSKNCSKQSGTYNQIIIFFITAQTIILIYTYAFRKATQKE